MHYIQEPLSCIETAAGNVASVNIFCGNTYTRTYKNTHLQKLGHDATTVYKHRSIDGSPVRGSSRGVPVPAICLSLPTLLLAQLTIQSQEPPMMRQQLCVPYYLLTVSDSRPSGRPQMLVVLANTRVIRCTHGQWSMCWIFKWVV